MRSIRVKAESAEYPIYVQQGLLARLASQLPGKSGERGPVFVVTSPEIWELWQKAFSESFLSEKNQVNVLFVPPGERHKRLATVERLAEELSHAGAKRDALLIAFGGGVIGDMTGFLAAIYMRGIRYVQVPTTYLAQIDSSLGGKTGVNLRAGKNLVGCFHHPLAVFTDPALLGTLPLREMRAGIVESIKAAVLGDIRYFNWLERNLDDLLQGDKAVLARAIETSVRIKAEIVSADERESGKRMLLNLGHTVGHAIESATRYATLLHGEAIAWGMLAAISLSRSRSLLSSAQAERIERLIYRLGPFPRFTSSARALLERTAADKKHSHAARRFVLPVGIGHAVVVEDVSRQELLDAIESMLRMVKERGI